MGCFLRNSAQHQKRWPSWSWGQAQIFHAVADAGSLTHAGENKPEPVAICGQPPDRAGWKEQLIPTCSRRHMRLRADPSRNKASLLFDATSRPCVKKTARYRCGAHPRQRRRRSLANCGRHHDNRLWHLIGWHLACPKLYEKHTTRLSSRPDAREERVLGPFLCVKRCGHPHERAVRRRSGAQKKLMMIKMCMYASPA